VTAKVFGEVALVSKAALDRYVFHIVNLKLLPSAISSVSFAKKWI